MADTKIASLTDGLTTSATDRIPVAISPYGSGNNAYITPSYLKTFMVTGGTVTSSTPVFDMTQTWNSGAVTFSGLKLNVTDTASASGSLLMDLQVGGSSKFNIRKDGLITMADSTITWGGTGLSITRGSGLNFILGSMSAVGQNGISIGNGNSLAFTASSNPQTSQDAFLLRDAANTLALANGTNAQTFNVYNTSTSSNANYERGSFKWNTNVFDIGVEAGGTGTIRTMRLNRLKGTTGASSAALGSNCPAVTATAPYSWIEVTTSDGSTAYVPAWK